MRVTPYYLIFTLVCLFSVLSAGQLQNFFSSEELGSRQTEAKKYLKGGATNAQDAYACAKLLESTQQKFECGCGDLKKLLEGEDFAGGAAFYYGVKALELCKCDVGNLSAPAALDAKMGSSDMVEYASAVLAAKALKKSSAPKAEDVVSKIKSYMLSSGLFKSNKGDKTSASIWKTKLAIVALSEYAQGSAELGEVSEAVAGLLMDAANARESDPTLLSYMQLLTGKKPVLDKVKGQSNVARLQAITEGLIALRHSGCMRTVASVVDSLVIAMSYKSKPVYVGLSKSTFILSDSDKTSTVVVKDVFGKAVDASEVTAVVKKAGKDKEVYSGALKSGKLDLKDMGVGRFSVDLSVSMADSKKAVEISLAVTVAQGADVKSVKASVSRSKGTATSSLGSVSKEGSAWDDEQVASTGNYVHVAFMVAPSSDSSARFKKPHQVFTRYTHQETGVSSYFVATADTGGDEGGVGGSSGHKYRSSVSVGAEAETFYFSSGAYDVAIIVGDDSFASGVEYSVGTLEMKFPEDPSKGKIAPLYVKSLMDASDRTLAPLPEIAHKMRPDPKNAPWILSVVFTALAIVPLVGFVGFILVVERPDMEYLLSSSFAGLYAAGVAGTLVLYAAYWFRMPGADFYQTIYYLCAIAPVIWFIARRGISGVIAKRVAAGKKD